MTTARTIVVLLAFSACSKSNPTCERAVKHVVGLTTTGPPGSEPSPDEQRAIDQVAKATIDACTKEGLSDAQRDCILAAKALDERTFLMCPALVAKKPSWLMAPIGHPQVLDEIRNLATDPASTP